MKKNTLPSRGFTLIELMVTIALAAILMAIAAPSFTTFQRNAELTSRINALLSSINAARSEAMKHGRDAVILPADSANWTSGMIAFVDMNSNRTFEPATDILVFKNSDAMPSYLSVTATNSANATAPYIRFDAQGYPKPAGSDLKNFSISIARNDVSGDEVFNQTRRLKVAITGRPRTCKPASASDTTCSASDE